MNTLVKSRMVHSLVTQFCKVLRLLTSLSLPHIQLEEHPVGFGQLVQKSQALLYSRDLPWSTHDKGTCKHYSPYYLANIANSSCPPGNIESVRISANDAITGLVVVGYLGHHWSYCQPICHHLTFFNPTMLMRRTISTIAGITLLVQT